MTPEPLPYLNKALKSGRFSQSGVTYDITVRAFMNATIVRVNDHYGRKSIDEVYTSLCIVTQFINL